MKRQLSYIVFLAAALASCEKKETHYDLQGCLTPEQQQKVLTSVMHYASKLAPEATPDTKFDAKFDWYYERAVKEAHIMYCALDTRDSTYHLFIARKARSITPMEEGIAVNLKWNAGHGKLSTYEEIFRTWKMPHDTLTKRGLFLFNTMMTGGDLKLYTSKFQQDRFIEFPDDRFVFDKEKRQWKDLEMDSVKLN
ncbi:hypothetical protein [Chryseolinea lacunae]|uniref:Lipoprotein n=1 Tax=Chryseolinea lacunae TaxID=2801331 RepID=A0ABS1KQZ8_9BACT|nr:hypothetical protein [Chryseolinea lacunae]MBL0741918.1 hypothetical protein [Chryseolinea lacunae]